nr:MAG TPA: hypothetical protein [Caudoviricetes sp.]
MRPGRDGKQISIPGSTNGWRLKRGRRGFLLERPEKSS